MDGACLRHEVTFMGAVVVGKGGFHCRTGQEEDDQRILRKSLGPTYNKALS